MQYASADEAPFIDKHHGPDLAARTKDALANIPRRHSLKVKGAKYPILRVFASWPGEAKLERTLGRVDPDRHPLATLHLGNFDKVRKELDRNWFQGGGQQVAPSRARKRALEEPESGLPSPKRRKVEA